MAITACAAKFVHQLDLLVGERANLLAVDGDRADQFVVLEHRNASKVRIAGDSTPGDGLDPCRNELVIDVGNLDSLLTACGQAVIA